MGERGEAGSSPARVTKEYLIGRKRERGTPTAQPVGSHRCLGACPALPWDSDARTRGQYGGTHPWPRFASRQTPRWTPATATARPTVADRRVGRFWHVRRRAIEWGRAVVARRVHTPEVVGSNPTPTTESKGITCDEWKPRSSEAACQRSASLITPARRIRTAAASAVRRSSTSTTCWPTTRGASRVSTAAGST